MAVTTVASSTITAGNEVAQWSRRFFKEYVRTERFSRYTGEDPNKVFQVVMDLTKKPGDNVTIALVTRLSNSGVAGDDTLEGNEEALGNYADTITVDQLRNAVAVGRHTQSHTLIDILESGRFMLKKWAMEQLRDLKINRLECPVLTGIVTYADATEAQKDAWLTQQETNRDRVLFGDLESNTSTGDHSASLANVDTTADTLDSGILSHLKRIAEQADPHITPITVGEDEEWYVAFCGSNPWRDAKTSLDTLHRDAAPRSMTENPLWRDGDLVYENIILRKIPEMDQVSTEGAASAPIYVVAVCGAQAVGLAWGELTHAIRNGPEGSDYGNLRGVGIAETRGAKKVFFNQIQHGIVTGYVAAAADT